MKANSAVNSSPVAGNQKLPSYTEVHTTSPIAAGLPVLEIVRKLEEEKILLRDDRIVLKEALYSSDPARREEVIKALCEVELNSQSRFAIRRLKAVLHRNNAGEVSSKNNRVSRELEGPKTGRSSQRPSPVPSAPRQSSYPDPEVSPEEESGAVSKPLAAARSSVSPTRPRSRDSPQSHGQASKTPSPVLRRSAEKSDGKQPGNNARNGDNTGNEDESEDMIDVRETITKLVGECPLYSGNDHFGVLLKLEKRVHDVSSKLSIEKLSKMRLAVIVGSGSYNPLTRIHLRTYYLAKQYLESKLGVLVLGSLLSPAHAVTVRERYRTHPLEILPAPHRLAIAQLLVESSQFLTIDPWEMTRRRAMDYLSLLEHTASILKARFPELFDKIKIFYLCKANNVVKLSPHALRAQNFSVVSVCRTSEADSLRLQLNAKWNGVIHVVEDSAILDASLDQVTSRKVRDKIKQGESVEQLVGSKINDYVNQHHLQQKVMIMSVVEYKCIALISCSCGQLNGLEEWTAEERSLPKIMARPAEPTLRSQQSVYSNQRREDDMSAATPAAAEYTPSWAGGGPSRNV